MALIQCANVLQTQRQPLSESEVEEAAAVLDMLLGTGIAAEDPEALRYVQSTAMLLELSAQLGLQDSNPAHHCCCPVCNSLPQ